MIIFFITALENQPSAKFKMQNNGKQKETSSILLSLSLKVIHYMYF